MSQKPRVVITGLGSVNPLGVNINQSFDALLSSKHAIKILPDELKKDLKVNVYAPCDDFSYDHILEAKTTKRLDRFILLSCVSARQALQDADLLNLTDYQRTRFGVSIGVGMGGVHTMSCASIAMHNTTTKKVSPFLIPRIIPNMAAGMVAIDNGLMGANMCQATACASGTHAIIDGYFAIMSGQTDMMIAGGAESAISKISLASFFNMRALSANSDPNRSSMPFDIERNGFVMAEGSGLCVLEKLSSAKKRNARIYAELIGIGLSCDAFHMTAPMTDGKGYKRCIDLALTNAKVNHDQINYINAHGTSTPLNDLYESLAIKSVFKNHTNKIAVSSTKGATGHLLGGAGGVEACFSALSIYHGVAPDNIGLQKHDPKCDLDLIKSAPRQMDIQYMLSNSFGFGGTNACLVLKKFTD